MLISLALLIFYNNMLKFPGSGLQEKSALVLP